MRASRLDGLCRVTFAQALTSQILDALHFMEICGVSDREVLADTSRPACV